MARKPLFRRATLALTLCGLALVVTGQQCCPFLGAGAPAPLAVEAGPNGAITLGGSFLLRGAASGGTEPYTFAWSPTTGLNNASLAQPTFTPASTGAFSFILTVNDGAGQVTSDTVTVVVNAADGGSDGDGSNGGTNGDGNGDGSGSPSRLVVNAGPDRTATTGSPITIQGFASGGQGPYTIAWSPADVLNLANTLTPSFTPAGGGTFTFTLTVTDQAGNTDSDTIKVTVSGKTTLSLLTWASGPGAGDGYEVLATFTRALNKASAEDETNYRISGTGGLPSAAVLTQDGLSVSLTFTGVALPSDTPLDISVGGGVTDTTGNSVPETKGLVPLAHPNDTTAPTVVAASVMWAVDYAGSYAVELPFSEPMDRTSVESPAAYRVKDGDNLLKAYSATLAGNGRTVTLVFEGKPLGVGTKLEAGLAPLKVKDINGQPLSPTGEIEIKANPADTTPPVVVDDSVRFAGNVTSVYQVRLDFNEAMDRVSVEQSAAACKVDGKGATTAQLGENGRRVLLTFENATASTTSKLSIDANKLQDINKKQVAAKTNLAILPAEATTPSPGAPTLTWLRGDESTGYQVRALFNRAMDRTTVENVDNWRINGTTIKPTAVALDATTAGERIAGRTATITFADFGTTTTRMTRTSKLDVSINAAAPIADVNGNVLESMVLPIQPNTNDTAPPTVQQGPVWGEDLAGASYTGSGYSVALAFSETMDAQSARNRESYLLAGLNPTGVTLDPTGRIVVLTFATTSGGIEGGEALRVYSSVRDINGRPTSSITPLTIAGNAADATAPQVTQIFWGINKSPYTVNVVFNEVMDAATVIDPAAYRLDGFLPASAVFSPDGKTLILEFVNSTFAPTAALEIAGDPNPNNSLAPDLAPRDMNGNAFDGTYGAAVSLPAPLGLPAPTGRPAVDREGPQLVSAIWDLNDAYSINHPPAYRVIATFNEAIDKTNAETLNCYRLNGIAANRAEFGWDPVTGTRLRVVLTFDALFNRTSPLQVVTFSPPMAPPVNVLDMHGNRCLASATVQANPDDRYAAVTYADATWAADYGTDPADDPGYKLTVLFSDEVLDLRSAESEANYGIYGTFINPYAAVLTTPSDEAANPALAAGRTVTLYFQPTELTRGLGADDKLDVSISGSISDLSGNFFMQQLGVFIQPNPNDLNPPILLEGTRSSGMATLVFNEAMDRVTAETRANYSFIDANSDPIEDSQGNPIDAPSSVRLLADGRTVQVMCQKVIGATDGLIVSIGTSVMDINLNAVAETKILPFPYMP